MHILWVRGTEQGRGVRSMMGAVLASFVGGHAGRQWAEPKVIHGTLKEKMGTLPPRPSCSLALPASLL